MMEKVFLAFLVFTVSAAFALTPRKRACLTLGQIRMDMGVTASNMLNMNTTRTPEGGPYLRKVLQCKEFKCEVLTENKVKYKYEPDHPDATAQGYVAYPDMSLDQENLHMDDLVREYGETVRICNR
jgi:flagellar basal-body rod protein FlgC